MESCLNFFLKKKIYTFIKIPILNNVKMIEKIPNGSLVRYRGMIQDIFDLGGYLLILFLNKIEYYLGIYEEENKKTGEKVSYNLV